MKYLLLLNRGAAEDLPEPGSAAAARLFRGYEAATGAMGAAGVLVDCAPLESASVATTVRVRDGEVLLTDGPAAELTEQIGGYTIIDCADLDEAIKWAAMIPAASEASVEIRPIAAVRVPS